LKEEREKIGSGHREMSRILKYGEKAAVTKEERALP
jgi:hypothetical protein